MREGIVVYCSVLQFVLNKTVSTKSHIEGCGVLQCVAVCCSSVLQCVLTKTVSTKSHIEGCACARFTNDSTLEIILRPSAIF